MRTVAVIGASLAGLGTARALREQGYDGRLLLIGDEREPPYDRPPLSKEYLAGEVDEAAIGLGEPEDERLGFEWRLGSAATALAPAERAVRLDDGSKVEADAVVLATGARARRLPGALPLRSIDDARRIRERLRPGVRVVLVGAGFIGAEIASTAATAGAEVTVVELAPVPLAEPLGAELGKVCGGWHAANGVTLRTGTAVRAVTERAVELEDGTELPADLVIAGVGARPCTEWLSGSGLDAEGGVPTDSRCATSISGVVAVGDCARTERAFSRQARRIEHWTNAVNQARIAAGTLLGATDHPSPREEVPYFWSQQYGHRLQFAGTRAEGDRVSIVAGDPDSGKFAATYSDGGVPHAVLAVNDPKTFGKLRRELTSAIATPV